MDSFVKKKMCHVVSFVTGWVTDRFSYCVLWQLSVPLLWEMM